jgi:Ca-activated chloride channel homolog
MMVMPPGNGAAAERMPRETILIVDTSGSMTGTSIEQARSALLMALDRLLPGDRFNVIQFNSVTHGLFPGAVFASPGNLEEARRYVRSLKAAGGTEMRPALELALQTGAPSGFVRQVIFMTDGAVGNEDQLIRVIHDKLGSSRLFTVGIGAAPNSFFMTKAAQFGRGTFTYIGDVREVHEKMTGLFSKLESPVLKDVVVHWPQGVKAETWPERIPDLYSGEPIVVLAQVDNNVGPLYVSGLRGNQPWSMALTSPEQRVGNGVGALWARHKIANLMDQARSGADPGKVRASVLEVALEHRLVSKYTSMVAVDVTPARTQHAGLKSSILPTNTPANWGQQGELPQTATSATQNLIAGSLALLLATMLLLGKRRRAGGVL